MAVELKSLRFYGLRSFERKEDEENPFHEIKFHPKLTILKGRNGSGKTAAMECLVFALAGKLPASPEKLTSFINGLEIGQVAQIILALRKGEDDYEIEWSIERPNKEIRATCRITCNGRPIHEGRLSSKAAPTAINEILNLPSGVLEKLLLVVQEDTLWPFTTATTLKQVVDKFLGLEEDNATLEKLVAKRKSLQNALKNHTPLLKPALEKAASEMKAIEANNIAREEQVRCLSAESELENTNKELESQFKQYNEIKDLEIKVLDAQKLTEALQLGDLASFKKEMRQLTIQVSGMETELEKGRAFKQELEKELDEVSTQYDTAHEEYTRTKVKNERAEKAKLKAESLSQSMSQDPASYEMDIKKQIAEQEDQLKEVEDEYSMILRNSTNFEREKARIETLLEENDRNITKEEENLAMLKDRLIAYTIQDCKIGVLEEIVPEFMEKLQRHTRSLEQHQLVNIPLIERYQTELSGVVDVTKELGWAEGNLAATEEFLKELELVSGTVVNIIIHQRQEKIQQLRNTVVNLKQALIKKTETCETIKKLLFEQLRLNLVCDLVERYNAVADQTNQENGKPAKIAKLDTFSNGLSLVSLQEKEINVKEQDLQQLKNTRPSQEKDCQLIQDNIYKATDLVKQNRSRYDQILVELYNLITTRNTLKDLKIEAEEFADLEEIEAILENYKAQKENVKSHVSQTVETVENIQKDLQAQQIRVNHLRDAESKIMALTSAKNNLQSAKASLSTHKLEQFPDLGTLTIHIANLEKLLNLNRYDLKTAAANLAAAVTKVSVYQKEMEKFHNASIFLKTLQDQQSSLKINIEQTVNDEKGKRNDILQKHKDMIGNINQYLQDQWMVLYPHDDISTILLEAAIKSEGDIRVDYEYHFKMQRCGNNGVLQMRGRSSYGEKILASLIIRCAFAAKFASGCPIVAFDEPQGGLDAGVVEVLADHFSTITGSSQVIVTSYNETFCQELARKFGGAYTLYEIQKVDGISTITEGGSS